MENNWVVNLNLESVIKLANLQVEHKSLIYFKI